MKWILVLLCAALATGGNMVAAQSFPSKPIHVIVNFTPGGPTDLVARMLAPRMTLDFGQSVIVDNRPSANGVLGSEQAARSAPDGHTLLFSTSSHTSLLAALYGNKVTFDPFRDIAPISLLVVSSQMIVAHPSLGVKTIGDMVKLAKAKPNVLNFGTGGAGTANHLGIELIKVMAGVDIVHVPYKGIAQATSDLLGGRVQLMLSSMASVLPYPVFNNRQNTSL